MDWSAKITYEPGQRVEYRGWHRIVPWYRRWLSWWRYAITEEYGTRKYVVQSVVQSIAKSL